MNWLSDQMTVRLLSAFAVTLIVTQSIAGVLLVEEVLPGAEVSSSDAAATRTSETRSPSPSPTLSGTPTPSPSARATADPADPRDPGERPSASPSPIVGPPLRPSEPPPIDPPPVVPTPEPVIPPGGATVSCSNGVDNSGGLGLICETTVVNTITATGLSAVVTTRECHGAAGAPQALCSTETTNFGQLVISVRQCNDSINGGGGTLRCSVSIINNFVDLSPRPAPVEVYQCVGSGGGIVGGCVPYPAIAAGEAINQCNGSANGGTLVGMGCVATGSQSASVSVTIDQCNGSANGGGALVICSSSITNKRGA